MVSLKNLEEWRGVHESLSRLSRLSRLTGLIFSPDQIKSQEVQMASKSARKRAQEQQRKAEYQVEVAEFRGFSLKRMNRAQSRVSTVGTGTDRRKPVNQKANVGRVRITDGSDNPRKVKASAPRGTFIQYGARTKEGQMENKQRAPEDKRKMWTQGYTYGRWEQGRSVVAISD